MGSSLLVCHKALTQLSLCLQASLIIMHCIEVGPFQGKHTHRRTNRIGLHKEEKKNLRGQPLFPKSSQTYVGKQILPLDLIFTFEEMWLIQWPYSSLPLKPTLFVNTCCSDFNSISVRPEPATLNSWYWTTAKAIQLSWWS